MKDEKFKKLGIVLEVDEKGNYSYNRVANVDEVENCNIIELDELRSLAFIKLKEVRTWAKLQNNSNTLVLTFNDDVYSALLEEQLNNGISIEDSTELIRNMLQSNAAYINNVNFETHGGISSILLGFDKELIKENKNSEEDVNKKTEEKTGDQQDIEGKTTEIDISKINPDEIIAKIKKKVIAQDRTVETVVNNIYNNQLVIESEDSNLINSSKSSILLDGPTGTGKTLIIKEVAKEMSLPMIIRSSTIFSAAGYKGEDLVEMLAGLLKITDGNLEMAERGIIVLDEFDKLAGNGNNELEMKKAVQQELLAFLGGAKYPVEYEGKTIEFDTSKITFICLGAFTDLRERKISEGVDNEGYYNIKPEDYINEGLLREIVGRFSLITSTQALSKEDMISILNKSEISPLTQLKNLAAVYNKELVFDKELVDEIATIAYENNTGARALQTVCNGLRNMYLKEFRDVTKDKIYVTKDMLKKSHEISIRRKVA